MIMLKIINKIFLKIIPITYYGKQCSRNISEHTLNFLLYYFRNTIDDTKQAKSYYVGYIWYECLLFFQEKLGYIWYACLLFFQEKLSMFWSIIVPMCLLDWCCNQCLFHLVWCRRTDESADGPIASHLTPKAIDRREKRLMAYLKASHLMYLVLLYMIQYPNSRLIYR